ARAAGQAALRPAGADGANRQRVECCTARSHERPRAGGEEESRVIGLELSPLGGYWSGQVAAVRGQLQQAKPSGAGRDGRRRGPERWSRYSKRAVGASQAERRWS